MYLAITSRSFLGDTFARPRCQVGTAPNAPHVITHRCWSPSTDCSPLWREPADGSARQNWPAGAVVRSGGPMLNPSVEQSLGEMSEVPQGYLDSDALMLLARDRKSTR